MSRFHLHHGRLMVFTHLLDLTTKNGCQVLKGALEHWILNGQMQQFLFNVYLTLSLFQTNTIETFEHFVSYCRLRDLQFCIVDKLRISDHRHMPNQEAC